MSIKRQGKLFFVFSALLFLGSGLSAASESLLTRTWKFEDFRSSRQMPKQFQAEIEKYITDMRKGYTVTYKTDGTYIANMSGSVLNGKYVYSSDSAKISVTTDKGIQKEYKVVQLTEDTFAFKAKEGQEEVEFVMVPASRSSNTWIWIIVIGGLILVASAFIAYREKSGSAGKY